MKAHILIVADGRSPTAQSWIDNIQSLDYQVSLVSTYPCDAPDNLADVRILPVSFSRFSSGSKTSSRPTQKSRLKSWIRRLTPAFQTLRYFLGPLTLPRVRGEYQRIIEDLQPDLVHALRIPFEGMLASMTPAGIPLAVAIWGNDLTLHARGALVMRRWTRRCLKRADGLTADARRDLRLASEWGLDPRAPTLVVPGSGGLDLDAVNKARPADPARFGLPKADAWILNPRGLRPGSVHQKAFFGAIPKVLSARPGVIFICPGLKGQPMVENWVRSLGIEGSTFLLPHLPQEELWSLMKRADLFVSPSSHDGTPNSFLEALACGCFPVVGNIESLREWIQPGDNGLLVDPRDPVALADGILWALDHPQIRDRAVSMNLGILTERADPSATHPQIDAFYSKLIA